MTSKILELTEKIYNEGVVKAQIDADIIIAEANKEANNIIQSAQKNANKLIEKAEQTAHEIKTNSDAELQLAARQFTSKLKQKIAEIISLPQKQNPIKKSFEDVAFIQSIILKTVQNWNPQNPEELNLKILLPEKDKKLLDNFIQEQTFETLNKSISFVLDPKTKTGFKISPSKGNYIISFSGDDFENFFKTYFREKTKKLLFE